PRWFGAVVKNMTQVRIRMLGTDFSSNHEMLAIVKLNQIVFLERFGEARPAGSGIEFIERAEERFPGDHVHINARLLIVPVLIMKRRFGSLVLGDFILLGR